MRHGAVGNEFRLLVNRLQRQDQAKERLARRKERREKRGAGAAPKNPRKPADNSP